MIRIERVVVTGGRKFTDGTRIEADLRALLPLGLRRMAEGACPLGGADDLAYEAWRRTCYVREDCGGKRYPMRRDLDGLGRQAYLDRNIRMLEAEKPDLVLAYPDPDSRGTWHCVREALARNIVVAVWTPTVCDYGSDLAPRIKAYGAIGREFDVVSDVQRHVVGPARDVDPVAIIAGVGPDDLDHIAAVARALRGKEDSADLIVCRGPALQRRAT